MAAENLLPEALQQLWRCVDQGSLTPTQFDIEHARLIEEYREAWKQALMLDGHRDLAESLLRELGAYVGCHDVAEIRRRCQAAHGAAPWYSRTHEAPAHYYDETEAYIYDLVWWHTLSEHHDPLAYILARDFARQRGCRRCLDFGAGIGSGAIILARDRSQVTLADVSSRMLRFCRWRFRLRQMPGHFIDLTQGKLPTDAFELVVAIDVLELLPDPVATLQHLGAALTPGGYLFTRFNTVTDGERFPGIVRDFRPTRAALQRLGFRKVWDDGWVWGCEVFQRP